MSKSSYVSTEDQLKRSKDSANDDKTVEVSSGAIGNETVKKKESSKNDIQESEKSEEAQSQTGKSCSKDNKELTPSTQKSTEKEKRFAPVRKLYFESDSSLEKARAKIKEYFEEEDSLQYSDDVIYKYFEKDNKGLEWRFLLAKMLEERKLKRKPLTINDLKNPGIYYLKLHQDVHFPDPPNTKIPCHYVGQTKDVYQRIGEHLRKNYDKIDQQLTAFPPTKYNWSLRVVMFKEIQDDVDEIKELQAVKGNEGELLKVLEKIAIMEMKSLYPNGYNISLVMLTSITYVDYEFTFKEN